MDIVREAAWVARCVGRGEWAPLAASDLDELSARLGVRSFGPGEVLFRQVRRRTPSG